MRGRFATAAVVCGGLWALACGGGGFAPPADPVPVPVPVPVPEIDPAPTPTPAADVGSRCPDGIIVAPIWQGEYPGPVVDVKTAVSVPARAKPCDGATSLTCSLAPGLYHPWAAAWPSYATVRAVQRAKARRAWTGSADDGTSVSVKAGDVVEVTAYLGEGFCQWSIAGHEINAECPEMLSDDQGEVFEVVPAPEVADIEVLGIPCGDGKTGWIDVDEALFARPEVAEGVVLEYGKVGPEGSAPE